MFTRSCVAVKELVLFARNYADLPFSILVVSLSWGVLVTMSVLAIMVTFTPTTIEASSVLILVILLSWFITIVAHLVILRHRVEREFCDDVIYALMTERLDSDL